MTPERTEQAMGTEIIVQAEVEQGERAEEIHAEDPGAPAVGRWYWVKPSNPKAYRWFGCITHVGSNYAELQGPEGQERRVHLDEFWDTCEFIEDPDAHIKSQVEAHQREVHALMEEVKAITNRLAVTTGPALRSGQETAALSVFRGESMNEYKAALVKAKETDLPSLFKQIKEANTSLGRWLGASIIPLKAQAESMEPAIDSIKKRIFNVELYAGLVEEVVQVREGKPAELTAKVHLLQRRCYMDEECLARYEAGGMEFKDLPAFDHWLARAENFERILPFPRCIVAFQVRRNRKDRGDFHSFGSFIKMMEMEKLDKLTFLYIRNGEQLFRLGTAIEFDQKLFPDMDRQALGGKLYAKVYGNGGVQSIISVNEWLGMVEDENEQQKKYDAAPEDDKWRHRVHRSSDSYHPFVPSSVYYDDIAQHVQEEMEKHNRLTLALQGLLDRSPVLHPHPAWQLWTQGGFEQALALIYDDSRALTTGDRPDFEAFREKLNASLKVGSVTVGQDDAWLLVEGEKESLRRQSRRGSDYYPERYHPPGNPGPGRLARVAALTRSKATYQWERERQVVREDWNGERNNEPVGCTFTCDRSQVLNVDAYKPGDFRQFFNDPRTRADYLQWAWLLLKAEDYHKKAAPLPPLKDRKPKAPPSAAGRRKYQERKACQALLGKAVRLTRKVHMKDGKTVYENGTLWRVDYVAAGRKLRVEGIKKDGTLDRDEKDWLRSINGLTLHDVEEDYTIPPAPEKK